MGVTREQAMLLGLIGFVLVVIAGVWLISGQPSESAFLVSLGAGSAP